ncbi:hypothetical protein IQ251_10555 [Saccharopolyspora sp. HNM0983]|uniref:Uncharacterized protein n=1 Tax=Saccharopolyspora montiporae TaxID=2781240 RepID=A0A929BC18_9PSEU|nr:hypothetical protein [Saccharopolyspora sp. HNM0983]MBE9374883.1 hypothetical protein [Saccharopolyspora sp. HNM0983]
MTQPDPFEATPPDEPSKPDRPKALDQSFWCGVASVVIGFLVVITGFVLMPAGDLDAVLQEVARQEPSLSPEQIRSVYDATMIVTLVFLVVIAAGWILFLHQMRRGYNWARIVITVVGGLWAVLTLPSIATGGEGSLLAILQLIAIGATVVLAFRPESNAYLRSAS